MISSSGRESIARMIQPSEEKTEDYGTKFLEDSMSLISKSQISDMLKTTQHQLIVLGNGFDLECGLHSRFADFEKARLKIIELSSVAKDTNGESFIQRLRKNGITAWDVILAGDVYRSWSDIESAIQGWMTQLNEDESAPYSVVTDFLNEENATEMRILHQPNCGVSQWLSEKTEIRVAQFLYCSYFDCRHTGNTMNIWTTAEVAELMLEELHEFERDFAEYLSQEVANNSEYQENALKLLKKIFEILPENYQVDSNHKFSILDFNYTNPFQRVVEKSLDNFSTAVVNVHGSLQNRNIIFGIDGKEHMAEPDVLLFTKTYRLLLLDNKDVSKLAYPESPGAVMGTSTALIKFYGHSLAMSDYSYFQAIFDEIDLYKSNVKIIFLYRPWIKDDGERTSEIEARDGMCHKVSQLLTTYGSTMENKDHGKNLMHKLLLEGRLSVRQI